MIGWLGVLFGLCVSCSRSLLFSVSSFLIYLCSCDIPLCLCGLGNTSKLHKLLSSLLPFLWCTVSQGKRFLHKCLAITRRCSKTYRLLPCAIGKKKLFSLVMVTIRYPSLVRWFPPFQPGCFPLCIRYSREQLLHLIHLPLATSYLLTERALPQSTHWWMV